MKGKEIQEKANVHLKLQNNKKVQSLKEKGITLIALVVTIILLLILAGVTISQIAGSNGLFQRTRQAVEKYKNAAEEEQIQIGMLEQYVSDFSVVSGDEGEDKASVTIKELTVEGNPKEQTIKVNLTIEGQASKIQLSIDNGKTWVPSEEEELEGTEGVEEETEYTHTFENLGLGKSYYVRVKVYDAEERYVEAISDIVTLSNEMTATVADVLETKTFLSKDGSVLTGQMKNNKGMDATLSAGDTKKIPAGYTSGGTITAKDLASQTPGDATVNDIAKGKRAWVDGKELIGDAIVTSSFEEPFGLFTIGRGGPSYAWESSGFFDNEIWEVQGLKGDGDLRDTIYSQATITFKKNIQCKVRYMTIGRGRHSINIKVNSSNVGSDEFLKRTMFNANDTITADISINSEDSGFGVGIFLFYDIVVLN